VVNSELNTAQLSGAEGAASEVRHLSRPRLAIRRRSVVAVSAHPPYLLAGIHGCPPAPVASMGERNKRAVLQAPPIKPGAGTVRARVGQALRDGTMTARSSSPRAPTSPDDSC
jgi:hypothetical protein